MCGVLGPRDAGTGRSCLEQIQCCGKIQGNQKKAETKASRLSLARIELIGELLLRSSRHLSYLCTVRVKRKPRFSFLETGDFPFMRLLNFSFKALL
jgi:hypothetical protein